MSATSFFHRRVFRQPGFFCTHNHSAQILAHHASDSHAAALSPRLAGDRKLVLAQCQGALPRDDRDHVRVELPRASGDPPESFSNLILRHFFVELSGVRDDRRVVIHACSARRDGGRLPCTVAERVFFQQWRQRVRRSDPATFSDLVSHPTLRWRCRISPAREARRPRLDVVPRK